MSHQFPIIEDADNLKLDKVINAVLENPKRASRRFRKERERAHSNTPKAALLSLLISKEYAAKQTHQLLDFTLAQLEDSTRRLAESPQTRYASDISPEFSNKVVQSVYDAQEVASRAQSNANAYKFQLEEAAKEIQRANESMRLLQQQREEAERQAAEARDVARQIREEHLILMAREEGRRSGFDDGFEHGRQVARAQRERLRIESGRRRSRTSSRMIEDVRVDPEPEPQTTPTSETAIPVPPPRSPTPEVLTPIPEVATPEPQPVPEVMRQPERSSFVIERPSSVASRSTRSSLRRQPAFSSLQERSSDVFLDSPGGNPDAMPSFPTQPSVSSSQLGPEVTPTPAARPPSGTFENMPEAIVMPQPAAQERPRSVSSFGAVPPPGMISDQHAPPAGSMSPAPPPGVISSYTPVPRPASAASTVTLTSRPRVRSDAQHSTRPSSAASSTAAAPAHYLRMPEPPPSLIRSSSTRSGSSGPTSVRSTSFGAAPPPPPMAPSESVPRQPSRSSSRASSSNHSYGAAPVPPPMISMHAAPIYHGRSSSVQGIYGSTYGTAPPPPPMAPSEPVARQPSRSSSRQGPAHPSVYGVAPPPPPMMPADPVARQPSRSSSRQGSSAHPNLYGVAPPPAPMMPADYAPRQPSRSESRPNLYRTAIYGPATGSTDYLPPRTRSTSLSSAGSMPRPEPPTPSSTATGFSQLELMNFPNPAMEYTNISRRDRRDSLRDRDRDRYVNELTAIPEHLTGSSRTSQSPNVHVNTSPHSTFDPSLPPPPFSAQSAQSWSSIPTVPTPSSISSNWLPHSDRDPPEWALPVPNPTLTTRAASPTTPEIVVIPDNDPSGHVPPPFDLEHDNFLGPSSARRSGFPSHNSSSTVDSRRYSTESSSTVGITIEPPSRPSSVTGQSRPPSVTGIGLLSPNHAHTNLPTVPSQPNPQSTPVIPAPANGLPPGFVAMAFTSPANAPSPLHPVPSSPSGHGRATPRSPYAPVLPLSTEAPVIPVIPGDFPGDSEPQAGSSHTRAGSSGGAESYAVAPTPPGFSYPAPLGATPGGGAYLRALPNRDNEDSGTEEPVKPPTPPPVAAPKAKAGKAGKGRGRKR
ncbi:hypothetical protein PC9H_008552 [Pleurotus ostreatus]|uniref:Uncharacterized protein n=1 Tax=Pleurotus ostreatus TaxID=5322 RepID=A0A8H6ZNZ8_PLEOS|nr:uncharacterized protein PC9H_008552 [Pleurotus ostreatus]KAF7426185.1 hypothetical protein PC9H_008552 [Pleurotus ostreatus]KAJ8693642.1 hypothetical protein PTI98_008622 [Pleurotus ostreatus]